MSDLSGATFKSHRMTTSREKPEDYDETVERLVALVRSKDFRPDPGSHTELERIHCIPHVYNALVEMCSLWHDYDATVREFERWRAAARGKDGLIEGWRIPKDVEERFTRAEQEYDTAQEVFTAHLEAEIILVLQDALAMLGITRWETVCEIARCSIRGGIPKIPLPKISLPNVIPNAAAPAVAEVQSAEAFEPKSEQPDPIDHWGDTPGETYVKRYMEHTRAAHLDLNWVAEGINVGELIECPQCHFLRLPRPAFPFETLIIGQQGQPVENACDVCFCTAEAGRLNVYSQNIVDELLDAGTLLRAARTKRARILFDLWLSSTSGADCLVWDAMRQGIQQAVSAAQAGFRTPDAQPSEVSS